MPGIYSKPPRRADFAADIRCLVKAATDGFKSEEEWDACAQTLIDEIEAERSKARQEALTECNDTGKGTEGNESSKQRNKLQQAVARKEMEVAEVFFECGVHGLFCKILEGSIEPVNPAIYSQILNVYQVLHLVEVDPFDDDMGIVSLLNYFLSERHSYYVDINWRDSELSHMQVFLSALLNFLCHRISDECPSALSCSTASDTSSEDMKCNQSTDPWTPTRLTAISLLHSTLWTFPPHRVVRHNQSRMESFSWAEHCWSQRVSKYNLRNSEKCNHILTALLLWTLLQVSRMALCFSHVRCSELLKSFTNWLTISASSDEQLIRLQVQTVAAMAFFGMGPSLTRKLVPAALCWSCSSFACREERCPCNKCEFQRRILKLARNRDELGVQASTEAKRQICYSLVRAGVTDFLVQILNATKTVGGEQNESNVPSSVLDILQGIAWILLLCSWAYEGVNQGQSILSAHNMKLLKATMDVLDALYANSPEMELFCDDSAATLLRVIVALVLRTKPAERKSLMLVAGPKFVKIASCLCNRLVQLSPAACSTGEPLQDSHFIESSASTASGNPSVPVGDATLDPKEIALKSSLILFSIMELLFDPESAASSTARGTGQDGHTPNMSRDTTQLTMRACQALIEIFEYLHPRFANLTDKTKAEGDDCTLDVPAVRAPEEVTGQGVEQIRWRFIENPAAAIQPASAGGFASSARFLLSHYSKAQSEGCQIVKRLAGLVILRSEQAAGMVLRSREMASLSLK